MPKEMRAGLPELGPSSAYIPYGERVRWSSMTRRRWKIQHIVNRIGESCTDEAPYVLMVLDYEHIKWAAGCHIVWALRYWFKPCPENRYPRTGSLFITRHDLTYTGVWHTSGEREAAFTYDEPIYLTCPLKFLEWSPPVNHHWRHQVRAFNQLPVRLQKQLTRK
jgi:hypothetical protein